MIFLLCNAYNYLKLFFTHLTLVCNVFTSIVYYIRVYVTHTIPLEIPREGTPRVIIRNIEERAKALTEHSQQPYNNDKPERGFINSCTLYSQYLQCHNYVERTMCPNRYGLAKRLINRKGFHMYLSNYANINFKRRYKNITYRVNQYNPSVQLY